MVEVDYCGVCGSRPPPDRRGLGPTRRRAGPRVDRRGGRASATAWPTWRPGDRVLAVAGPRCGTLPGLPGRAGRRSASTRRPMTGEFDGAFATHVVPATGRSVWPCPTAWTCGTAALAEPLAVALHAITRSEHPARPGRPWCSGAGPDRRADRRHARGARATGWWWSSRPRSARSWPVAWASTRSATRRTCARSTWREVDSLADDAVPRGVRLVGQAGRHGGRLPPAAPRRPAGPGGHRAWSRRRSTPTA